jgi:hypothetical protein
MRLERVKNKNPRRIKSRFVVYGTYTPGFPIQVEEHPIIHRLSLITYKVLSKVALTLRPFIVHQS